MHFGEQTIRMSVLASSSQTISTYQGAFDPGQLREGIINIAEIHSRDSYTPQVFIDCDARARDSCNRFEDLTISPGEAAKGPIA